MQTHPIKFPSRPTSTISGRVALKSFNHGPRKFLIFHRFLLKLSGPDSFLLMRYYGVIHQVTFCRGKLSEADLNEVARPKAVAKKILKCRQGTIINFPPDSGIVGLEMLRY